MVLKTVYNFNLIAGLAQLVEQLICNQKVTSSTLVAGTTSLYIKSSFIKCLPKAALQI